jgi:imidazolonepropionase-like amidohydrolase
VTVRIEAELLIPGRGEPVDDGTVVLDAGRVTYAGPAGSAPSTPDAEVTEVRTVMPGLWECHGHFSGLPRPDLLEFVSEPTSRNAARAVTDMSRVLDGGVTSVREVGGLGLDIAPAVDDGAVRGPRIHGAGAVLSTTGGHGDIHNVPLDMVAHIDGFGILCDGVPECLRAVRLNLRKGAKVIKVCASGGVMSEVDHPIHQQFSDEELQAIVEEATRAERVVAAHCHGKPGIMAALRAGAKTIEHGSFLDEEAADLMAEKNAVLVPTRWIVDALLTMEDGLPAYAYRKILFVADAHAQAMKIAIAAGVTIAMGTDMFVSGAIHGRNSAEIPLLVDAGLSPLEAIEAATANGPLTLGPQAPESGQLREGFDADVIAVDFNPLDDVALWGNPDRITHVWKGGTPEKKTSVG